MFSETGEREEIVPLEEEIGKEEEEEVEEEELGEVVKELESFRPQPEEVSAQPSAPPTQPLPPPPKPVLEEVKSEKVERRPSPPAVVPESVMKIISDLGLKKIDEVVRAPRLRISYTKTGRLIATLRPSNKFELYVDPSGKIYVVVGVGKSRFVKAGEDAEAIAPLFGVAKDSKKIFRLRLVKCGNGVCIYVCEDRS